jgi:hypothetical protein
MKKGKLFLAGMLVVVLISGLVFTGCPWNKDDEDGVDVSTSWEQQEWISWFNNNEANSKNVSAIVEFRSKNNFWARHTTTWWTPLFTDWSNSYYNSSAYNPSTPSGSSVTKPNKLSTGASYNEAMNKLDEIISYCDANPGGANASIKSAMATMKSSVMPSVQSTWSVTGGVAQITQINAYIDNLQ